MDDQDLFVSAPAGWWCATDGKWYPPEQHHYYQSKTLRPQAEPEEMGRSLAAVYFEDSGRKFRSRTVVRSGWIYVATGVFIASLGATVLEYTRLFRGVSVTISTAVIGMVLCLFGGARLLSHLRIYRDRIEWTWLFFRHRLPMDDLKSASLIETGSSISETTESELTRAFFGPLVFGVTALARSLTHTGPTMGLMTLAVEKRNGPWVRIHPIGTTAGPEKDAKAYTALHALQAALALAGSNRVMSTRERKIHQWHHANRGATL